MPLHHWVYWATFSLSANPTYYKYFQPNLQSENSPTIQVRPKLILLSSHPLNPLISPFNNRKSLRASFEFDFAVHTQNSLRSLHDQIFKPSKLPASADFHLFKDGIEPKWEDPECANGGKWTLTSKGKGNLDTVWLETLMALIGEQFGDSEDICGVVVSVRQWQDKLSLWTKTTANESVQVSVVIVSRMYIMEHVH
ncbi:Eukaryotic initiation factor 4E protein [Trifolium repens]|nr:Eukaryotic initiation factor 4E protein [Trifolium repens]